MSKQKHWIIGFFFPWKNGKLTPVLCNQVTQCSVSLTVSLVSAASTNVIPTIRGKRILDYTCIHNIVPVNCHTCTYFSPNKTENQFISYCNKLKKGVTDRQNWSGPILDRACMWLFRKRATNALKGQKRAKYLKIWAKMYKIRKYFEKGLVIAWDYCTQ